MGYHFASATQPRRLGRRWGAAAITAFGLLAAGCAVTGTSVQGSGGVVEQARAMPYFTALRVGGAYDVHVLAGATPDVTVHADASLLPYIETTTDRDTLSVGTRRGASLRPSQTPRLDLFTWQLRDITAAGVGDLQVTQLAGDTLTVRFTGAERSTLSGTVRRLRVEVAGAATVDARDLAAEIVDVVIRGVGEVSVTARDRLAVEISGTGEVQYAGHPREVTQRISGAGEVRPLP